MHVPWSLEKKQAHRGKNGIELNMAKAKHMELDALDWSQFGIVTIVSILNAYTITKTKVFF